MKSIKIVGVPEHFNYPWHLSINKGLFKKNNIDLKWQDVPEGTGKMCQMLKDGETDLAIVLTEGIVKEILNNNNCSIIQVYVKSPLVWGIHVAAKSDYKSKKDLQNKTVAISRYGSGSHLMSYVYSKTNNWSVDNLNFNVVNTLDNAVETLTKGEADYFMWEKFTTQPLVDKNIFRRIDECPTPWPCFVIAVRNEVLENEKESLKTILKIINTTTKTFKQINNIDSILAVKYKLDFNKVRDWLVITEWSQSNLSANMLNKIQNQLLDLKIINKKGIFATIISNV